MSHLRSFLKPNPCRNSSDVAIVYLVANCRTMSQKQQAEKLFNQGETIATIATKLGVSRRTIERWANDGAWREKRSNVVSIADGAKKKPLQQSPESDHNPAPIRRRSRGGDIDELDLVDLALSDVSAAMSGAGQEDIRSLGSLATALCRLVELRLKLKPRTAAELAELAIALKLSPTEFARELRQAYEKRA